MGMTITEKIVAAHAGRDSVRAGEIVTAKLDLVHGNELSTVVAVREFERIPGAKVFDPSKVTIVSDHFTPNNNITTAALAKKVREWARQHGIQHYFEVGKGGIEHTVLPDEGLIKPGMMIIGGDSHTCTFGALNCFSTGVGSTDLAVALALGEWWMRVPETIRIDFKGTPRPWVVGKDIILWAIKTMGVDGARYKAIELHGDTIRDLSVVGRLTMTNMAIEMGAKNGVMECDAKTEEFLRERGVTSWTAYTSDPDAEYCQRVTIDCDELEPVVAFPHLPSNGHLLSEIEEKITVDQVFIGSCTNGRIEDLRLAAQVMKGKKVAENLRCIVIPASQNAYKQACREGLAELFVEAGCVFSTPTCGPCFGGHMGVMGAGEKCLSTTNRNFVGRMGHRESEIYLSNPAVAGATAILGYIGGPADLGLTEPEGIDEPLAMSL